MPRMKGIFSRSKETSNTNNDGTAGTTKSERKKERRTSRRRSNMSNSSPLNVSNSSSQATPQKQTASPLLSAQSAREAQQKNTSPKSSISKKGDIPATVNKTIFIPVRSTEGDLGTPQINNLIPEEGKAQLLSSMPSLSLDQSVHPILEDTGTNSSSAGETNSIIPQSPNNIQPIAPSAEFPTSPPVQQYPPPPQQQNYHPSPLLPQIHITENHIDFNEEHGLPEFLPPPHHPPNMFVTPLPSINNLTEEFRRVDNHEFYTASRIIRLLNEAIANEGDGRNATNYTHNLETMFSYDPAHVFLCVQGTTLRLHSYWLEMQDERKIILEERATRQRQEEELNEPNLDGDGDGDEDKEDHHRQQQQQKQQQQRLHRQEEDSNSYERSLRLDIEAMDIEEWDETEKITWELWENSIWCCALLAEFCVGPAWYHQIMQRRLLLAGRNTSGQGSVASSRRRGRNRHHTRTDDSVSTLGMSSAVMRGNQYQRNSPSLVDNYQSDETDQNSGTSSIGSNPQSAAYAGKQNNKREEVPFPVIPEILPIALLRFVASFSESLVPPVTSPDTLVTLTANDELEEEVQAEMLLDDFDESIASLVQEEQNWLIRRQRIGEAQRDLVLAVCWCEEDDEGENDSEDIHRSGIESSSISRRSRMSQRSINSLSSRKDNNARWLIPGAHTPVAIMVNFWIETAKVGWPMEVVREELDEAHPSNGRFAIFHEDGINTTSKPQIEIEWNLLAAEGAIDWWYALSVTRAISDLVSVGWRPPPNGPIGETSILCLMTLAEKGVLFAPNSMKFFPDQTTQEAREERLVATSSTAEAIGAITCLGSRGYIPTTCVSSVATYLCWLLAVTDSSISNVFDSDLYPLHEPSDQEEAEKLEYERSTFITQRESCLTDTAELLWSMLAHNSSMCLTADALLSVIDIEISLKGGDTEYMIDSIDLEANLLPATGAIRALGAALWGNPPQVKGIQALRIYWCVFIRLLATLSSSLYSSEAFISSPLEKPTPPPSSMRSYNSRLSDNSNETNGPDIFNTLTFSLSISDYRQSQLVVILEVVLALRRLIDGNLSSGFDTLSPLEWEPLISLLETGLLPWLAGFPNGIDTEHSFDECDNFEAERNICLAQKIRVEVQDIFTHVFEFLTMKREGYHWSQPIIDIISQRRLYLFYFRNVSPSLSPDESTNIAISIIKLWVGQGGIFYRSQEWCKKASDILSEAFATYKDGRYGHPGGYVHSPIVRLVAMVTFTENKLSSEGTEHMNATDISYSTGSGEIDPNAVRRYALDVHLDEICRILLPFLAECLGLPNAKQNGLVLPNPVSISDSMHEKLSGNEVGETSLCKSAVKILGDLFQKSTIDKQRRISLLETLFKFIEDSSSVSENSNLKQSGINERFTPTLSEFVELKLEAVRQVGCCLRSAFDVLPQAHSNIPKIIEGLCEVSKQYLDLFTVENGESDGGKISLSIISFSCIYQLACLRVNHDCKAKIIDLSDAMSKLPSDLRPVLQKTIYSDNDTVTSLGSEHSVNEYTGETEESSRSLVAKFLFINSKPKSTAEGTILTYQSIFETACSILNSNPAANEEKIAFCGLEVGDDDNFTDLFMHIRIFCYEILKNFCINGLIEIFMAKEADIDWLLKKHDNSIHCDEKIARCRLIASYTGYYNASMKAATRWNLYQELIDFCCDSNKILVLEGCQGITFMIADLNKASRKAKPFHHDDNEDEANIALWTHDASKKIINRLESLFDSCEEESNEKMGSNKEYLYVPLLSILLDICSLSQRNLCPPQETRLRIVVACSKICLQLSTESFPSQACLLSLQCTASAIKSMAEYELKSVEAPLNEIKQKFKPTTKTAGFEENGELPDIISDFVTQQIFYRLNATADKRDINLFQKYTNLELTASESLAKDVEDIESFPVNNTNAMSTSAWLYQDMLFTYRIGSGESRFRGWVEITVRSPSCRIRRLFKPYDQRMSLKNPDFPLKMWDLLLKQKQNDIGNLVPLFTSADDLQGCDSEVVSKAKDVIQEIDKMTIQRDSIPSSSTKDELKSDENTDRSKVKALHQRITQEIHESFGLKTSEMAQLKYNSQTQRAINVLDRTAFLQTHKIALMYVGPDTSSEKIKESTSSNTREDMKENFGIFSAFNASPIFWKFCEDIGKLVPTRHLKYFSGGLDTSAYADDGDFAISWVDNDRVGDARTMVLFHTVPLMPSGLNNRKRHVGNDVVHIIFVDRFADTHVINTNNSVISGQFGFVTIYVIPPIGGENLVRITVKVRPDLDENIKNNLVYLAGSSIVLAQNAAVYVRQIAIRADLACRSLMQDRLGLFSNWQERQVQIRELDRYLEK